MVRQHHFIRAALTDILEEVRLVKLDSKPADQEVRISIFEKYNFPIRSDEALLELEKHLADEEARKLVVILYIHLEYFKQISIKNYYSEVHESFVKNILAPTSIIFYLMFVI